MEEILKSSLIKGLVFSAFDQFGPQPKYMFPDVIDDDELKELKKKGEKTSRLTLRDYIQISIKNLSLLLGDKALTDEEYITTRDHFGILPYPDFNLTSLTYFRFIKTEVHERVTPSAFSILVDENRRSFLYSNVNRIKPLVTEFFKKLEKLIQKGYRPQEEVQHIFRDLLMELIDLEKRPFAPVTSQRKMKILFAGLDNSGKTSFLFSIDRKYSKLIGLKPTRGVNVNSIEALGATIFLWDLGGQLGFRETYLNKSQIYLYEADLLFYFIDIRNPERYEESMKYLNDILERIKTFEQKTPIIFILTKGDPDIIETDELQENLKIIKQKLEENNLNGEVEYYITSIFSIFSILRAFSSGISQLSPNKELINFNLTNLAMGADIYLALFLNADGLVLADYYSQEAIILTELPQSVVDESDEENIRNVFEVTAPQFAVLHKIFSKFRTLEQEEAIFKIAESIILLKKVMISEQTMFLLFLMDDEEKREKVNQLLPDFIMKTSDLLLRYIS